MGAYLNIDFLLDAVNHKLLEHFERKGYVRSMDFQAISEESAAEFEKRLMQYLDENNCLGRHEVLKTLDTHYEYMLQRLVNGAVTSGKIVQ